MGWEGEVGGKSVETVGIKATSSCILPMPTRPFHGKYHIYHFYLMMEYCCTHSTLGFGGLGNSQFMIGNSGRVITWWPMVKHSVSTKAQWKAKAVS